MRSGMERKPSEVRYAVKEPGSAREFDIEPEPPLSPSCRSGGLCRSCPRCAAGDRGKGNDPDYREGPTETFG